MNCTMKTPVHLKIYRLHVLVSTLIRRDPKSQLLI